MDDIADDVELSKATLYLYFKNKPSLYFAVVIKGMVILRDAFKNSVKNETTGLGKLKGIIHAFYNYIQIHSNYYHLNLSARDPRFTKFIQNEEDNKIKIDNAEDYTRLTKELLDMLIEVVSLGIKDGTVRKDLDLIQTVMYLSSAIESIVYISPVNKLLLEIYGISEQGYLQHSIDVILHGIVGENNI